MTPRYLRAAPDERLTDLARSGSEAAFEAIVERYRLALVKYAAGMVGADAADEVVQEALVCAHIALRRGDEVACLRAWLYRIVRNKGLNLVRDRGPAAVPLDELQAALDTPERTAETRQTLRTVVAAVQGLPLKQRDAIVLRELEGRSYDEIAGRLGVSDPAVRGLLNRARMTLRRAAAALAPLWPGRMAELWSAGAMSSTGAARACATCVVAAVATLGGLGVEAQRDPDRRSSAGAAEAVARVPEPRSTRSRLAAARETTRTTPAVTRPAARPERAGGVLRVAEPPAADRRAAAMVPVAEPEPNAPEREAPARPDRPPEDRREPREPRRSDAGAPPRPEGEAETVSFSGDSGLSGATDQRSADVYEAHDRPRRHGDAGGTWDRAGR